VNLCAHNSIIDRLDRQKYNISKVYMDCKLIDMPNCNIIKCVLLDVDNTILLTYY